MAAIVAKKKRKNLYTVDNFLYMLIIYTPCFMSTTVWFVVVGVLLFFLPPTKPKNTINAFHVYLNVHANDLNTISIQTRVHIILIVILR